MDKPEPPYLETRRVVVTRRYNPRYGDDRLCTCGHPYHRHFDSFEEMEDAGCKYCQCQDFVEASAGAPTENEGTPEQRAEAFARTSLPALAEDLRTWMRRGKLPDDALFHRLASQVAEVHGDDDAYQMAERLVIKLSLERSASGS